MSLSDIDVVVDDELITIQEQYGNINIYLRENMQESDRSAVNFVLIEYFQKELKIHGKNTNLANLLMSAPLSQLPKILEKNNISVPEGMMEDEADEKKRNVQNMEVTAPSPSEKVPRNKHDSTERGGNTHINNHGHDDRELSIVPKTRKRGRSRTPERGSLPSQSRKVIILDTTDNEGTEKDPRAKFRSAAKTPDPKTEAAASLGGLSSPQRVIVLDDSDSESNGPETRRKRHSSKREKHSAAPKPPDRGIASLVHKVTENSPCSPSPTTPSPPSPTRPLRELVPSHQARIERVVQTASTFRMANAQVPATPDPNLVEREAPGVVRRSRRIQAKSAPDAGSGGGGSAPGPGGSSASTPAPAPSSAPPTPLRNGRNGRGRRDAESSSRYHQKASTRARAQGGRHEREEDEVMEREIGFLGELFVYELFSRQIDDWTFKSWTSNMRSEAGHPPFTGRQKDFADFTYCDRFGHMRKALQEAGVKLNPQWSNNTEFHLEVKATLGRCADAFYVSQNQVDKMRQFDRDPNNAYIILRVFGVEERNDTGIKFLQDPWSLYMDQTLDIRSETGVYKVY
ncbi:hypothetical protein MMYC01_200766 [Madurella mycetomatis]|uniref:Uncharacterized protein n=1 Tax=Madurella mycetomatis TaxID=100816 RepID=A0A175WGF2_9PEZI|nr:hypothetical protein MMYC01_200766 [Madurella mycetomatis]